MYACEMLIWASVCLLWPDVTAALEYSQAAQHKLAKLADLQVENDRLKDTLQGYSAELKDVKSQGKWSARIASLGVVWYELS